MSDFSRAHPERLGATKIVAALALILLTAVSIAACAGEGREQANRNQEQTTGEPTTEKRSPGKGAHAEARAGGGSAVAKAGDAEARAGGGSAVARAGDIEARAGGSEEKQGVTGGQGGAREAALAMEGTPGTEFSGACFVGGDKKELSGRVPERFVYRLDGETLKCEIRKQSAGGKLRAVLEAEGSRSVTEIDARDGAVKLDYDGRSVSVSRSSISVNQSSSSVSRSSSSVHQSSSSVHQSVSSSSSASSSD